MCHHQKLQPLQTRHFKLISLIFPLTFFSTAIVAVNNGGPGFPTNYEICWDDFDPILRRQCMKGEWQQKYYYDHPTQTCRLFWYDGCRSDESRNFFDDLLQCQYLCEQQPRDKATVCLEPFDQHYRDLCEGGKWSERYYFDKKKKECTLFWYGGCSGTSKNLFDDKQSCVERCEMSPSITGSTTRTATKSMSGKKPTKVPPRQIVPTTAETTPAVRIVPAFPRTRPTPVPTRRRTTPTPTSTTTSVNICDRENPCQNGGTCVFDLRRMTYICNCAPGFTNDNCTERADFDPCAKKPCLNGATCTASAGPTESTYDCFCPKGFAGKHCELKPCESKPCQNGGNCRTTRGATLFFCECAPGWGGKTCIIPIPSDPRNRTAMYGGSDGEPQLSSGKAAWMEDIRRTTTTTLTPNDGQIPSSMLGPRITSSADEDVDSAAMATLSSDVEDEEDSEDDDQMATSKRSKDDGSAEVGAAGLPPRIVGEENPTRTLSGLKTTTDKSGAMWSSAMPMTWTMGLGLIISLFLLLL